MAAGFTGALSGAQQEAAKYELCAPFGHRLPRLRRRVEEDLARRSHSKERTLAAIVKLLDTCNLRIGNESYAKANKSFGLTTLRDDAMRVLKASFPDSPYVTGQVAVAEKPWWRLW